MLPSASLAIIWERIGIVAPGAVAVAAIVASVAVHVDVVFENSQDQRAVLMRRMIKL